MSACQDHGLIYGWWEATYEIDADNKLCPVPLAAFYFCQTALPVCVGAGRCGCAVAVPGRLLVLLLLHRVARRGRLTVHLVLLRMAVATAGVDWWRHGGGGPALVRIWRTKIGIAGTGILV